MISIAHRIELKPNNKQKTYFRKAFGCARLAYNWGLAEWKRKYEAGERTTGRSLRNEFNAIRKEQFPFTYEVTKYATARAFDHLQVAFDKFFKHTAAYPQFKKKRDANGSFYIGADQVVLSDTNRNSKHFKNMCHNEQQKHQYLKVPNLGWVKMTERVRFIGKINGVNVSQEGDRFYASFSMMITEEEYKRTHPHFEEDKQGRKVGIDMGIKSALILSDGIAIDNPHTLKNNLRKIRRLSKQLSKRQHAKTKQERLQGVKKSNRYIKLALKLNNAQRRVADNRRDFTQKVTTILTTHYAEIAIEDLNVKGMVRNHHLAQSVNDVAMGELRREIEYKAGYNSVTVTKADRFYPSSKTCSVCGNVRDELKLSERVYHCPACGATLDRDYNASLNLLRLLSNNKIGIDGPESTPADLTALQSRFSVNGIATSKVETGKQQKSYVLHV